jgi:transposase
LPGIACLRCDIWKKNRELEAENAQLKLELGRAQERIFQLEAQVKQLGRRLAVYEEKREVSRSRRRPAVREYTITRFPGKPRGSRGATRPLPKPDQVVEAEALESCPECGARLGPPVHNRERIVEELPEAQPVRTILYREYHYICPDCGSELVARHPECPPKGRFGKNVYVQTTLLKFLERLPLAKISQVLERQGLKVSEPTVLSLLDRASTWLRPEYEKIAELVRSSDNAGTDQTSLKVDGVNYWIWAFTTNSETLYTIRPTKGRKVLEEVLGPKWKGTLVCDGLRSHHTFAKKTGAGIQRCWAHLLRDARNLEDLREGQALSSALHRLYDRLTKAVGHMPPPEERRRLLRNARRTMQRWLSRNYRSREVRRFVEKVRRGFDFWFTFVLDPRVPPTNNATEGALRELVVQRKIIGTLRNGRGVRIYETLPTLLETWKRRGLNPQDELSKALMRAWAKLGKA